MGTRGSILVSSELSIEETDLSGQSQEIEVDLSVVFLACDQKYSHLGLSHTRRNFATDKYSFSTVNVARLPSTVCLNLGLSTNSFTV